MTERICYIWAWHLVIITACRLQTVLHSNGWRWNGISDWKALLGTGAKNATTTPTTHCGVYFPSPSGVKDEDFPPSRLRVVETTGEGLKQPQRVLIYGSDRNRAS
jgi:hypothetical protein